MTDPLARLSKFIETPNGKPLVVAVLRCEKCGGDRDADTGDAMQPGDTLCASCDGEEDRAAR